MRFQVWIILTEIYGRWFEVRMSRNGFPMTEKRRQEHEKKIPNLARHERGCHICAHDHRREIEEEFIAWKSPAKIAREYGLRDRASVYRHAHATNLFPRRARNVRAALERIIEQADGVAVTAAAVVQAIATYARINARGELIERDQQGNLNDLFDRMTRDELENYASTGVLPPWFTENARYNTDGRSGSQRRCVT
jgi:hypothetical protein